MYSDQELIDMIRQGGAGNEEAWRFMLKNWRTKFFSKLKTAGASEDDCLNVLNEIYEPIVNRIRNIDQQEIGNLAAFISTSMLYKWYKTHQKPVEFLTLDPDLKVVDLINSEAETLDVETLNNLHRILNNLNKNCAQILYLWSEGFSMSYIAERLNYKDAEAMKKKKYKCLEQAKTLSVKFKIRNYD
ncbi:MAG: hypothetical protein IT266_11425 [Saprospiraceae bacterium]|nr:hypothetical protein [Saprospiraceae bacterium]